ncbi:MAG: lysylphosphatidylglycerol synthase transmembrane domain-containing protein [Ectothiorhodospiraceae bacterium]|jgi:uncharacterized membrane protein YbhN (UPF0104 family)|nr:lysylphosphatidylglycerol synthase transmembrane domain-containing protein [Ectothiorhodospiraceae bacterium]
MPKPLLKHLVALLILIAFLLAVEWWYGWAPLLAPWRTLSPLAIAAAALLTLLTYWLRTMRFYDYFRREMQGGFATCFKLQLQHNLFNNLLPARTGELSFPVLMSRWFGVPVIHSMTALFWFRLLDLHTLGLVALAAVGGHWLGLPVAVAATLAWLPLPWFAHHFGRALRKRLHGHEGRIGRLVLKALDSLPQDDGAFWRAWAWTVVNWAVKLGAFAWVLWLFVPAPAAGLLLAVILGDLTSVLPVHGIAGAGTYEAGVVAGLAPFGIALKEALAGAVNLHLFMLGATLIGGAASVLLPSGNGGGAG